MYKRQHTHTHTHTHTHSKTKPDHESDMQLDMCFTVSGTMKDILLFDGGLATEIAKYVGVSEKEINKSPLWCSHYMKLNRDACVQVCRSYVRGNITC